MEAKLRISEGSSEELKESSYSSPFFNQPKKNLDKDEKMIIDTFFKFPLIKIIELPVDDVMFALKYIIGDAELTTEKTDFFEEKNVWNDISLLKKFLDVTKASTSDVCPDKKARINYMESLIQNEIVNLKNGLVSTVGLIF